jgi:hypothetical protein
MRIKSTTAFRAYANARTKRSILATPASESWCVNTEDFNESGRVYLELADATPAEAARGMALLTKVAEAGATPKIA